MAEPMKPKRGFVDRKSWPGFDNCFEDRPQFFVTRGIDGVSVLVIPDPDRDPTPEEIEALGARLHDDVGTAIDQDTGPYAFAKWEQVPEAVKQHYREVARAAFRLGARVPS